MNKINEIKVFTDGSFKKMSIGVACGYGVYFPNNELPNIGRAFKHTPLTNQRAELYAIYKAIRVIIKSSIKWDFIHIYTDSEYSIKSLTEWVKNWEKNNWKNSKGDDVLNQDIIKPIYKILKKYKNKIIFTHVRSHTGATNFESISNDMADKLANEGAFKSLNIK
jgi:ribonuclease HI